MSDTSKPVKKTFLIWVGAIAVGIGVFIPWIHVLEKLPTVGWQTQHIHAGLDLVKPPFDTRLPGIALGLSVVSLFLGFFVSRKTASARFLSVIIIVAGLAAVAVMIYVYNLAQPGHVFRGLEGITRNELELGFIVTLVGGFLLFLGGVVALVRAKKRQT